MKTYLRTDLTTEQYNVGFVVFSVCFGVLYVLFSAFYVGFVVLSLDKIGRML